MRRVGFFIMTPTFGGPHNQALRLFGALKELGWWVKVITTDAPGNGASRLEENGIPVRQIDLPRLRRGFSRQFVSLLEVLSSIPRLIQVIKEEKCDLVQFCGVQNFHVGIAARAAGIPVVCQLLGTFAPKLMRISVSPIVSLFIDVIMAVGRKVMSEHPWISIRNQPVFYFLPPVDTGRLFILSQKREEVKRKLGLDSRSLVVLTLGNFAPCKGHDVLVEAAGVVFKKTPNVCFCVLGSYTKDFEDYYRRTVIERAKNLGLIERGAVRFIEAGSLAHEYLAIGDLFVISSVAEGVPTAMLEAMAMGMPVVSTAVGSIPEVIEESKAGILVPPRNPKKLAEAILRLVENPPLAMEFSRNALVFVREHVDVKKCAEVHAKAYGYACKKAIKKRRLGN